MRKLWGVTDMFIILSVMLVLQMYMYVKSFQIIYFKHEQLIAYQVNLNKTVKKKTINRTCEWIGGGVAQGREKETSGVTPAPSSQLDPLRDGGAIS